ncbi:hydrogenase maturation nickel metallochaperone HypA [Methylicorpusculum sp.]|uniref:hydrogenase maturation nickel metallochaperone HypA n=2 Tax=Methylicorpusculum sp. TaxID=2713644 RepID=UPI0027285D3F|nr:hydrogenase maturation nickel metallochaperone HypA [Methylicorpusculum sp.]MDO8843142.1 hydrogenase maturation nickel metallochaperone HypA [Methylicorpusculum sp.]MDP2177399.1 hydrogenase maturation nickel metallochaperone HypA [Methylicorpusculum sp.]MDP3530155.1 hydrogenase maturation nickel metallochaperone HypA [Methylicorpusculum sp.]MDZ4151876.1 hydrogenase maturation nickel metallochaperone HypA [Methylicorpusculum sp.]
MNQTMHELSLCDDLIRQVQSLADQHHAQNIGQVTVSLGALSGVEPVLLVQAFEILKVGTAASNARLMINDVPVRIKCDDCGIEADADPNKLICPSCKSLDTQLLSGSEFILSQVELFVAS